MLHCYSTILGNINCGILIYFNNDNCITNLDICSISSHTIVYVLSVQCYSCLYDNLYSFLLYTIWNQLPLQTSFARLQNLPDFRRFIFGGRKYAAPFHFPYYTAFVEVSVSFLLVTHLQIVISKVVVCWIVKAKI